MSYKISKASIFVSLLFVLTLAFIGFLGTKMATNFDGISTNQVFSFISLPTTTSFWGLFIIGIALFGFAYWLTFILNNQFKFADKFGAKGGVFFFALVLCFPFSLLHLPSLIASIFCFISLRLLLNVYNQKSVLSLLFWSSFLVGIASIFFYPAAVFLVLVFITMAIFRPFEIRNIFISLIGFALPFFYLYSISYLMDISIVQTDFQNLKLKSLEFNELSFYSSGSILLFISTGLLSLSVVINRRKKVVRQQNQLMVLFLFLLFSSALILFVPFDLLLLLLSPPMVLFFLIFSQKVARKWLLNLYLTLVFLLCLLEQFHW